MTKFLPFLVFALLVVFTHAQHNFKVDVVDYGAVGDGRIDDTKAFMNAWEAICNSTDSSPTMHIPAGNTFLLQPIVFLGRCKSNNIKLIIDGTLTAPSDPFDWDCYENRCDKWIHFMHFDGLSIRGNGTINPKGQNWWDCHNNYENDCPKTPQVGFEISHSKNVQMNDLFFKDSPKMHIAIEDSTSVCISNLTIEAPWDSPNTDGIHVQRSTNVSITYSRIGTGDDCISIGDGTSDLHISNITCGPGHGISIGSLGKHGEYETVQNVRVRDVIFKNTTNGVRIKTWQGGRGYARNIYFERVQCDHAKNPIIIDQFYCDHEHCTNHTSAVKVSDIRYYHIHGTSNSETAVKFACSESIPCKRIYMSDVNIKSTKHKTTTTSFCSHAKGSQRGKAFPNVSCLNKQEDIILF